MHFDPTINLGNAISLVVFVGVLFRLHGDIVRQLTILNVKVETMWEIYTQHDRQDRRERADPPRHG